MLAMEKLWLPGVFFINTPMSAVKLLQYPESWSRISETIRVRPLVSGAGMGTADLHLRFPVASPARQRTWFGVGSEKRRLRSAQEATGRTQHILANAMRPATTATGCRSQNCAC